jgi:SAM-dependent methyltransferase
MPISGRPAFFAGSRPLFSAGTIYMDLNMQQESRLCSVRRWLKRFLKVEASRPDRPSSYEGKLQQELDFYKSCLNVHDLPQIFHYWSNKYLVPKLRPFGFDNAKEFFCMYMKRACTAFDNERCRFVSIGSGNCDFEIEIVQRLLDAGIRNFSLECLDINAEMLERGKAMANEKGVAENILFSEADINYWSPKWDYQIVMANQCLHHFVELEMLFDKVHRSLHPKGYFVTDDMIGRNGHLRWPEALCIVSQLWSELPDSYKYNHLLKRREIEYENWDCSKEGFEGIRAQDILPLLIRKFHFDFFVAFGNVIDIFVDRCFGHNFDANSEHDRAFIDRVHAIDELNLEKGTVKPTHMIAAMTKDPTRKTTIHKHLSPEFCVRWPD